MSSPNVLSRSKSLVCSQRCTSLTSLAPSWISSGYSARCVPPLLAVHAPHACTVDTHEWDLRSSSHCLQSFEGTPQAFMRQYQPVFDLVDFKLPASSAELRAVVPGLRRQWLHNHFDHTNRIGTASAEDRPIFIELSKCAHKLYRYALVVIHTRYASHAHVQCVALACNRRRQRLLVHVLDVPHHQLGGVCTLTRARLLVQLRHDLEAHGPAH